MLKIWYAEITMTMMRQRFLKAKVAMALYSEYGRVPKEEEIDHVYHLTRVLYKAVLGTYFLRKQQQKSAKRIKAEGEAKKRLAWVRHELDHLELPDSLPKGVCHGDTNPMNFLYHQGKLSGVLDFDQASYTWLLYDIAQMMYWLTWPNKGDLNFDASRNLIAKYEKQRRMTKRERAHLFDALKLVILIGISWFLEDDEGYANARRKVELLNKLWRERFLNYLFDTKAEHSIPEI